MRLARILVLGLWKVGAMLKYRSKSGVTQRGVEQDVWIRDNLQASNLLVLMQGTAFPA
jgi:hypothetical protein